MASPSHLKLSPRRRRMLQAVLENNGGGRRVLHRRRHRLDSGTAVCSFLLCLMLFWIFLSLLYEYAL